jgi:hypothetical protein
MVGCDCKWFPSPLISQFVLLLDSMPTHPRSLPFWLALTPQALACSVFGRRRLPPVNLDPCAGRGNPYAGRVTSWPPSLPHSRRDAHEPPPSSLWNCRRPLLHGTVPLSQLVLVYGSSMPTPLQLLLCRAALTLLSS